MPPRTIGIDDEVVLVGSLVTPYYSCARYCGMFGSNKVRPKSQAAERTHDCRRNRLAHPRGGPLGRGPNSDRESLWWECERGRRTSQPAPKDHHVVVAPIGRWSVMFNPCC